MVILTQKAIMSLHVCSWTHNYSNIKTMNEHLNVGMYYKHLNEHVMPYTTIG